MAEEIKSLMLTKEVNSSTTESNTVIPANGAEIEISFFEGHAAYTVNSCVKAIWDLDGTPEIIWSTKGDTTSNNLSFSATGDGSKKLAVCLENGEDGALVMSGMIKYLEVI